MKDFLNFLERSYSAYQAVENAEKLLLSHGFTALDESESWELKPSGKYYTVRGGSAIIAFTVNEGNKFRIVASHTDSPCLKLKENPVMRTEGFYKLNAETYGGGICYSFFDRPLKLAGRIVKDEDGALTVKNKVSDFNVTIPSLAIHMQREVNTAFAPNPQTDLLPLLSLREEQFDEFTENALAYDLYVTCAEKPFESGSHGEFISAPRIDNLTGVYSSLLALCESDPKTGVCVAACLDSEEVGSRTLQGAGGDFLKRVLKRIAMAQGLSKEEYLRALPSSFLLSLDNAHSLHPNRPEKCDPTNRVTMGGGVVIKSHADKAYTTDAATAAVVKKIFETAGVKYQSFFNRSDMRSGGTLGSVSLSQLCVPSADIGLAQLAMHSAVETLAKEDFYELLKGLTAFYQSDISFVGQKITVK